MRSASERPSTTQYKVGSIEGFDLGHLKPLKSHLRITLHQSSIKLHTNIMYAVAARRLLASATTIGAKTSVSPAQTPQYVAQTRSLWAGTTCKPSQDSTPPAMDDIAIPRSRPNSDHTIPPKRASDLGPTIKFIPTDARRSRFMSTIKINPIDPSLFTISPPTQQATSDSREIANHQGQIIKYAFPGMKDKSTSPTYNFPLSTCTRGLLRDHHWSGGRVVQTRGFWMLPESHCTSTKHNQDGSKQGQPSVWLFAGPALIILGCISINDLRKGSSSSSTSSSSK